MSSSQYTLRAKPKTTPWMLLDLLVIGYLAHKLFPAVGYYMPAAVYAGLFLLTVLFLLPSIAKTFTSAVTLRMLCIFSVSLLTMVRYGLGGSIATIPVYLYGELQIVLFSWIALWYSSHADPVRAKRILGFIFLAYIITSVTTYIGCVNNPLASRYMAANAGDDVNYLYYTSLNIGSFTFVYELVLLTPLVIYLLKSKNINRLLGVLSLVGIGAVIVITEYTTALLVFAFSLLLLFVRRLTSKKILIFLVCLIVFIVLNTLVLADVFKQLSQSMESDSTVGDRFAYLADVLSGKGSSDDGYDRMALYEISWDTFWNTDLLGDWGGNGAGGHSFVLDSLAHFGIVGLAAVVLMYRAIYKLVLQPYKGQNFYPYLFWLYCIGIFMAIINPKTYLFIFIGLIPLFARVMADRNAAKEEAK